jgi:hypothetical protein
MEAVLDAGRRSADLVVVDLPRSVDDSFRAVASLADVVLLVVPAEVRASAAASRVAARVALLSQDLRLVVRGPAPSRLSGSDLADSLALPLVGYLQPEPHLEATLERGEPPGQRGGPRARVCEQFLDHLAPVARRAA